MDQDFEGSLHDLKPEPDDDQRASSDEEEGDAERIEQQMGDVGDDEEVRCRT
jgi:midasin